MQRHYAKRRPGRGGARPVLRSKRSKPIYSFQSDHSIFIVAEPFGCGVDVIAPNPSLSSNHATHAASLAAAAQLSLAHGWPVVDHCGGDLA